MEGQFSEFHASMVQLTCDVRPGLPEVGQKSWTHDEQRRLTCPPMFAPDFDWLNRGVSAGRPARQIGSVIDAVPLLG
jgi:hypothetical protein